MSVVATSTKQATAPRPQAAAKEAGPFTTGTYWFALIVSLVSLVVLWLYYGSLWWIRLLYWVAILLALSLIAWSTGGLLTRYEVIQRVSATAAKRREARDLAPTGETQEIVYRENIVVRFFKFIGHLIALLFLFVWNTVLRIVFIIELTVLQTIILGYDIFYYVTYAAWTTTLVSLQLAWRIVRWALRVSWKILRILTLLPLARGLWRNRLRPVIMGRWNHRMDQIRRRNEVRRDQRRRLVAARGKDPDKWEKDWIARRRFPFPHPHEAKKGLSERIDDRKRVDYNRRDRWHAYRKGLPMPPKVHSQRRKRREEERKIRRGDKDEAKDEEVAGKRRTQS